MSRWGGPRGGDDLAYGDAPPQRWDRDTFERFGRGPPPTSPRQGQYEEDYRYQERDRPGRRDVLVADHIESRGPPTQFQDRGRFYEDERLGSGRGPQRRSDRELFGDQDPRELAGAMMPYRAKSTTRRESDFEQRSTAPPPRPGGLIRRQSSLDTFDRRPPPRHYDPPPQSEYRMPAYTPVPLPIRRDRRYEDGIPEDTRYDYEPEDYREVEIQRERSVHRRVPKSHKSAKSVKSSRAPKSVTTRRSSSSSSSSSATRVMQETIIKEHESFHGGPPSVHETIDKRFKKGKTRMPKRLIRREAIMDLGYPYDEEEDFFVLRIALEKDQIDEVMRISETYKTGEKKTVYEYRENIELAPAIPEQEHEEIVRTEWINPPSVSGARSHRSVSHSGRNHQTSHYTHRDSSSHWGGTTPRGTSPARTEKTARTARSRRRSSPGPEFFEERKTVIEETRSPPPPPPPAFPPPQSRYYEEDRRTVVEERAPMSPPNHSHAGTLVVQEREYRSDRDIQGEIARLEAERRALRLEREADERRDMATRLRSDEEYQLVEYRERGPPREVVEFVEREKEPPKSVVRVEKDRKERRKAKIVAAAIGTLT